MQESVQGESILETPFCLSMSRYVFRFSTRLQITTSLVIRLQISTRLQITTFTARLLCRACVGWSQVFNFRFKSSSMETSSRHIVTLALASWCTEIWSPCPYRVTRFLLRQACNTHRCAFSCCRCATILPFNRVWRLLSLY